MAIYEIDGTRPTLPDDGSAWVAPSADVIGDARLGREVGIWFGAVVRADNTPIIIGERTNIQEGAMLHSDPDAPLTIGKGVTVGHHAILHGCTVGDDALIGMGAILLNRSVIGAGCIVGAGALVTEGKEFPPGSLVVGSPARAVRTLEAGTIDMLRASAALYVDKQQQFARKLVRIDEVTND